ncbi:Ab-hydrolase associated lipase region protein (macronuclear) [Tetrahymena thermophila SB210]|uniref:Lipase n=1 Tax=Tetrahymena thermophila (strain SB210) TaxID=312017 RepID=Q22Z77_TETTS|nr:Ab-hydrolase associated lipase region protein [Tetrahymena thermophila SB210]EAR90444.2 Ab-hydrolase associated lipase region protein [Tetrahymena thermophila SB210]|eukprot:XP_001010689.2 Ab-hydrolase associated lipase region protein [Tetrahymena thermophila SB210]
MNLKILIFALAAISFCRCYYPTNAKIDYTKLPVLTNMTFPEMMKYLNYPMETHYITTEDGYILTFFRIQAKNSTIQSNLPAVYFQHGLGDSSDTICLNNEEIAPGLMIANAGYDLWLGNSRGNRYSMNHTIYSSNDTQFWQFTYQHIAHYDLPAAFEYIKKVTQQKIHYIGHSQGTIVMFMALARKDSKVINNLKSYIALGAVGKLCNIKSKLFSNLASLPVIDAIIASGAQQFFPYKNKQFTSILCTISPQLCGLTLEALMDLDDSYDNIDRMNILVGHCPAGTSTLNARHWAQNSRDKEFRYFDYGKLGNLKNYGSVLPPQIQLQDIDFPIHIFAGLTDELAPFDDVQILKNSLTGSPNVTLNIYPFGHASFLFAKNMSYVNDVFAIFKHYDQNQIQLEY